MTGPDRLVWTGHHVHGCEEPTNRDQLRADPPTTCCSCLPFPSTILFPCRVPGAQVGLLVALSYLPGTWEAK